MQDPYPSRVAAGPVLSPRVDPVVGGEWTPGSLLSLAAMNRFDRDGFLLLEDWFSADEVDALRKEAARLLGNPGALPAETLITEPGSDELRSIFSIDEQSALLSRLACDERMAGLASLLLGDDVYLHQSRLNYKPGFDGKEFYWHSDFETWHVEDGMPRMRALSISFLLAENTALNGALMLLPGSHRTFVGCVGKTPEAHYRQSLKKQEYGVPDRDSLAEMASRHGLVAATGKPGTLIVFDCNILHGSGSNITPFPRSNAFFVYNTVGNALTAPFGPEKPRPPYLGRRGAPVAIRIEKGRLASGTAGSSATS